MWKFEKYNIRETTVDVLYVSVQNMLQKTDLWANIAQTMNTASMFVSSCEIRSFPLKIIIFKTQVQKRRFHKTPVTWLMLPKKDRFGWQFQSDLEYQFASKDFLVLLHLGLQRYSNRLVFWQRKLTVSLPLFLCLLSRHATQMSIWDLLPNMQRFGVRIFGCRNTASCELNSTIWFDDPIESTKTQQDPQTLRRIRICDQLHFSNPRYVPNK